MSNKCVFCAINVESFMVYMNLDDRRRDGGPTPLWGLRNRECT